MKDFGQEFLPVSKIQTKLNSVMKIFVLYQHLAAKNHLNAYLVVRPFEAIKRNPELILSNALQRSTMCNFIKSLQFFEIIL